MRIRKAATALIALIAICLSSCTSKEPERRDYIDECYYVDKFEYKSHQYLFIGNKYNSDFSVIHDPDCSCNKKQETDYLDY